MVEVINYKNLNGLSGTFTLDKKINVFTGSNGEGKTTSLDCLALLLFGESFSYNKTLERHIDTYAKNEEDRKFEVSMVVSTNDTFINDEGKEEKVKVEFGYKATQNADKKFNGVWYVNKTKTTKEKYQTRLCEIFNIPSDLLSLQKINVLRVLVDPLELNRTENVGVYNLVKALTNVIGIEEFSKSNEDYQCILGQLAKSNYDIKDCKDTFKRAIEDLDKEIDYAVKYKDNKVNELKSLEFPYSEYNKKVEEYSKLVENINNLTNDRNIIQENISKSVENDNLELNRIRAEKATKLKEITNKFLYNQSIYNNNTNKYNNLTNDIENITNEIAIKNKELEVVKNREFEPITCPHCKEIVNISDFDSFKKSQVAEINSIKEAIKKLENEQKVKIKENDETIGIINSTVDILQDLNQQMKVANEELANEKTIVVEPSNETQKLKDDLDKLNIEIENKRIESKELSEYLNNCQNTISKINDLKQEIENLNASVVKSKMNKALFEQKQLTLKQFDLDYTKLLEEKISSVFDDVKINMIKEGKSSNAKLNCYAIQDDKPIYNYNTAPQIALGCKIINLIKKHLGIKNLPIMFDIVDNIGEKSFNDILKYCEGQLVCTKVIFSENNKLKLINNIKEIK